jgi:hypothetical protein
VALGQDALAAILQVDRVDIKQSFRGHDHHVRRIPIASNFKEEEEEEEVDFELASSIRLAKHCIARHDRMGNSTRSSLPPSSPHSWEASATQSPAAAPTAR